MAARLEIKRLEIRKAHLIKQNEFYRHDLQKEAENLQGVTEWIERGYGFFKTASGLRKSATSFLRPNGKNKTSLLRKCAVGWQIWKKFRQRLG